MRHQHQNSIKDFLHQTPPRVILPQNEFDKVLPVLQESIQQNVETCGLLRGIPLINEGLILITRILIPSHDLIHEQSSTYCELDPAYIITQITENTPENDEFLGRWHLHFELQSLSQTDIRGVHAFMNEPTLPRYHLHLEFLFINKTSEPQPLIRSFLFLKEHNMIEEIHLRPSLVLPRDVFTHLLPWFSKPKNRQEFLTLLKDSKLDTYLRETKMKYGSMLFTFQNKNKKNTLILPPFYTPSFIQTKNKWEPTTLTVLKNALLPTPKQNSKSSLFTIEIKTKNKVQRGKGDVKIQSRALLIQMNDFSLKFPLKKVKIQKIHKTHLVLLIKQSWFKHFQIKIEF